MEENALADPQMAPGGAGHQDGVQFSPSDTKDGLCGGPAGVEPLPVRSVACVRGICVELHVWCGRPVGLEEEACA